MSISLHTWRKKHGFSVADVAKELGVSVSSVYRYEDAEQPRIPDKEIIQKVHELTLGEVDANAFFGHGDHTSDALV